MAVIILSKDAEQNIEVSLHFGKGRTGAVETKTLHAPAPHSRGVASRGLPNLGVFRTASTR